MRVKVEPLRRFNTPSAFRTTGDGTNAELTVSNAEPLVAVNDVCALDRLLLDDGSFPSPLRGIEGEGVVLAITRGKKSNSEEGWTMVGG